MAAMDGQSRRRTMRGEAVEERGVGEDVGDEVEAVARRKADVLAIALRTLASNSDTEGNVACCGC